MLLPSNTQLQNRKARHHSNIVQVERGNNGAKGILQTTMYSLLGLDAFNWNGDLEDTCARLCDLAKYDAGTWTCQIFKVSKQRCI